MAIAVVNKSHSATKRGPGRVHASGHQKASPVKAKGAGPGFVQHYADPIKRARPRTAEPAQARYAGVATRTQGAPTADPLVGVTKTDANNYCRILTLLGMEDEGDPVAEVERLLRETGLPENIPAGADDIVRTIALALTRGYAPSEVLDENGPIVDRMRAYLATDKESLTVALKERPDFIAGYDAGLADGKRIAERERAGAPQPRTAEPPDELLHELQQLPALTENQITKHTLLARDCPPDSQVLLVASVKRLQERAVGATPQPRTAEPAPAQPDEAVEWLRTAHAAMVTALDSLTAYGRDDSAVEARGSINEARSAISHAVCVLGAEPPSQPRKHGRDELTIAKATGGTQ